MTGRNDKPDRQRSSLARQLAAMVYDALIITGLLIIAAALASPLDNGNQQAFRDPLFTAYLFATWFFYLSGCWMNGGMTVGMRAWKIVLLADDGPVSWKLCVIRFTTAMGSAAVMGLGFAWPLFDRRQRSWHDMASHSGLYRTFS